MKKILSALLIVIFFCVFNFIYNVKMGSSDNLDIDTKRLEDLIYQGYAKGPEQTSFEYEIDSKDWVSTVRNHPYYAYNQPHLSWKISWILDGLYYAYKSTGDEKFLRDSLHMYDCLLERRDDNENRVAWNGKIYPLWGSTSRYNGAFFPLIDEQGNRIGSIEFHGIHHDQTTVSIKRKSGQYFDLTINDKNKAYLLQDLTLNSIEKRVSEEIDWSYYGSPLEDNRVVKITLHESNLKNLPIECEGSLVNSMNVPNVVFSGLILKPMAQTYIELKRLNDPQAKKYKEIMEETIDALIELTWQEKESEYGFFKNPDNSPSFLGGNQILPWNQQVPLVAAMAILGAEEGNDYYKLVVKKWSNYFLKHVEKTKKGYVWKYWEDPTETITWSESTNYGGIDVEGIYIIYASGIAFNDTDMQEITNTIRYQVLGKDRTVSGDISGKNKKKEHFIYLYNYLPYAKEIPELIEWLNAEELEWYQASQVLYFYLKYKD